MCSLGKRVRIQVRRNWLRNNVERNQVSSPNPSLNPSSCGFIVTIVQEWANKDKYHLSNFVLQPRVQMPRAKAIVRTVPTWGDQKVAGGAAGRATPVRPVQVWTDRELVFVVGMRSLQVVSLLDVLSFVLNTGLRGVVALTWRGGTVHRLPFVVLVLLQLERVHSLVVVTVVVFVEVALIGEMF
jgi:hypothetical protein